MRVDEPTTPEDAAATASGSVRRLRMAASLFQFAYDVKRHQLSRANPSLSDAELHRATLRLIEQAADR